MHFDSGKFGAIVVVLSIVLTIVIGYCSDVTKVEVEKTDYDYITDITGLFETEQVPEYIDYNPNSNYVGYTGPVVYDTTSQPNNYRFIVQEGTTTNTSITVNSSSSYTNVSNFLPSDVGTTAYINYTGSLFNLGPAVVGLNNLTYNVGINQSKITSLGYVLDSIADFNTYATVDVNLYYSTQPVFLMVKPFSFYDIERGDGQTQYVYHTTLNDSEIPTRLSINVVTEVVTAYKGDSQIWTGIADNVQVIYGYSSREGGSFAPSSPSVTMDFSLTTSPTYGYADPTSGVTYDSTQTGAINWSNGYINESIRVLIGRNPNTSGVWSSGEFNFFDVVSLLDYANTNFEISWNPSGELLIGTGTTTNLGKWQGAIVDFNYITGKLVVTPTGTIRDYMEVPSIQGDPYTYQESWEGVEGDSLIRSMSYIKSDTNDVRWGVQNTRVNLNTYNVVMNNPSIDIHDYWPNLDYYRLNFYSYALVGDSITINGVTYPIGDGQTITVTDVDGKTYTDVLSNIYVTVNGEDGTKRTSLTFVDSNTTIDLGETVSEVVSYSGLWYFTTALYDAETVLVSEYEWNLDGDWSATSGQVLAIFLGLCVGGILIGRVFFKDSLGGWDYLVIGIAIVIAFAIAEVFV